MSLYLGLGLSLTNRASAAGPAAPALTSLDFDQADTAGGDSVTITGTDLTAASSCTVGGTSATITANTSTTLTFTMPAKAAGSYNVQVTTAGGASNTLSLEAWGPEQLTGVTAGFERPNYTAGTGTWAYRIGGADADNGGLAAPAASSGSPNFAGAGSEGIRLSQNEGAAFTMTGTPKGSVLMVINPDTLAADAGASTPYANVNLWCHEARGVLGCDLSASGVGMWASDGSYRRGTAAISAGVINAVCTRFESGVEVAAKVGSGAWASTALGTYSPTTTNIVQLGANYNASTTYDGTMRAAFFCNVRCSDAEAVKFRKWAMCRHGAV